MNKLLFKVYRSDSVEPATSFDMGDIEFSFGGKIVSSRGNSRWSNMIYVSMVDLIDGLLQLKKGGKHYKFVGADSSFTISFDQNKQGILVLHDKIRYGPFSLSELLESIDDGIDAFLANPRNKLSADSPMYDDFNTSRTALKNALS